MTDLRDPQWWVLLIWARIYFALIWLDRILKS